MAHRIWQAGAGLFAVLFMVSWVLVFLTSGVYVDGRRLPLLVDFLPAFPGGFRNPSSNGIGTIFWLCCAWALAVAVAVRLFFWWVLVQRNILAVVRTVLVFAFFLGLHLVADPGRPSRRSWAGMESSLNDWRFMASLYALLLLYASFPVALFWNETARPPAKPDRPAATDGRGSPPQRS